jgi:acyl-CoA synthetase (AMP-forming)/AMP-acid ligase II
MAASPSRTLIDVLAHRAREHHARQAFNFQGQAWSYGDLWHRIGCFGAHLLEHGLKSGDRVILALPNGPAFFTAFYGVQRAGGVPVPINPESGAERLSDIASSAGAEVMLVAPGRVEELRQEASVHVSTVPEYVLTASDESTSQPKAAFPAVRGDDLCYIQYTSGSTGDPKGVQLSHANVVANLQQLIAGMQITRRDVFVSWLPLFHDLGLVLMTMVPFFLGASLFLLPTRLTNVQEWLRAIEKHRGTFTAAPDFAYRFCLRYLKRPGRFDLSSLRLALNAAEPVRARTIEQFERVFGLKHVMCPGYGLAEATVGVSTWIPGAPVRVGAGGCLCVGPPFLGVDLKVVDGASPLKSGEIGEILVRSPSTTLGYYQNPQATSALKAENGFIRTGDLGYLDSDGYLYIVGRLKDIIIHAGENIVPREVEEVIDELSYVRSAAAVGIENNGDDGERVYIFTEVTKGRSSAPRDYTAMVIETVHIFHRRFGFRPGRVYLLAPNSIPRTPNGKIQRRLLRERYLNGQLRKDGCILYPDY